MRGLLQHDTLHSYHDFLTAYRLPDKAELFFRGTWLSATGCLKTMACLVGIASWDADVPQLPSEFGLRRCLPASALRAIFPCVLLCFMIRHIRADVDVVPLRTYLCVALFWSLVFY